jgi:hypothetical protein
MEDDGSEHQLLAKSVYSPETLAEALDYLVCDETIRRHCRSGKLKAKRMGGRNLVILRDDAIAWLNDLPSATEPTAYHGPKWKQRVPKRSKMSAAELAEDQGRGVRRRRKKSKRG